MIWIKQKLPWLIIIGFLVFLLINTGFVHKKEISRLERNYAIEKEGIQSELLKNGQELNTVRSKLLTEKELKQQASDSLKLILNQYKDVKATVVVNTVTKRDTLYIPYDSIINYVFRREFKHETQFSKITGVSTNEGVSINTNESYNEQNIVFGDKKEGWFKTEQSVSITNSNPNVKTTGIQSTVITERKKRWVIGAGGIIDHRGNIGGGIFVGYAFGRF